MVRRWSHQRSLASSSPVSTGIGDHLWRVNNPVFSRPLRPTQPAHPFLCRCNEHWRWFLPALGKKRRVTRSSHGRLLYASLIGSNPVQLKAQRGWAPSRRTSRCMHKSSYFSSLVLYSVNHLWSEGWLQHVMIFCHSYGSSPSVLIQSVSECGSSIEVLGCPLRLYPALLLLEWAPSPSMATASWRDMTDEWQLLSFNCF